MNSSSIYHGGRRNKKIDGGRICLRTFCLYVDDHINLLQRKKGLTMPRFFLCAATFLLCWTLPTSVVAQVDQARPSALRDSVMVDQTLGISFLRIGNATRHDANGYSMSLQNPGGKIRVATAAILVSSERVVDLSGSYGGKLYLDKPMAKALLTNRVKVDSVSISGLWFRREFWAVYAGMGAWEGVTNCYAFLNGQYYVLSLSAELTLGKPGEIVDGEGTSAELLRGRVVDILSDGREPVVQKFNDLLVSFQVSR
jgi:hypothetical protein